MATVLVVDDDKVLSHLVSSLLREKGQERVRLLGADAVLSKPLVPEELFEALTKAL